MATRQTKGSERRWRARVKTHGLSIISGHLHRVKKQKKSSGSSARSMNSKKGYAMPDNAQGTYDHSLATARAHVDRWVHEERSLYADKKYDAALRNIGVEVLKDEGYVSGGYWDTFVTNQLSRLLKFPADTPQFKQALGKMIVVVHSLADAEVLAFGEFPAPGHPSGEIHESTPRTGLR